MTHACSPVSPPEILDRGEVPLTGLCVTVTDVFACSLVTACSYQSR